MGVIVDDYGNIELYQGDSGMFVIEDLPTDKAYTVYFGIYNANREVIGSEINVNANYSPSVVISLPTSLTDLLTVPKNDDSAEYYYGIKLCLSDTGEEDTLTIDNNDIGDLNRVTVYPKKIEGLYYTAPTT